MNDLGYPRFWLFGLFFFLYSFIMGAHFPLSSFSFHNINRISKSYSGIIFAPFSLFS
ncbi:MFS transporter, partial [Staphylococcus aureus]